MATWVKKNLKVSMFPFLFFRHFPEDRSVTTVVTETKPLQRSRRVDAEKWRKYVDFTSDILSHLRILHIKAVTRNLIFFPPREQLKL